MKKKIIITLMSIVGVLLIAVNIFAITKDKKPQEINYNTFLEKVESGTVESAIIDTKSGTVTFKLSDDKQSYVTNYPYSDDFMENLLLKNVDATKKDKKSFAEYSFILSDVILVALIAVMAKSLKGFNGVTTESGKEIKTRFSDIAGMPEIKEEMKDLISLIKADEVKDMQVRLPHGILFDGPPGNGKTLLAKAIAGETGINFIAVNACDFVSPLMGQSASRINDVFKEAKRNAPSIIFIDEIDAIGSTRTAANNATDKEANSTLTAILNNMDGFSSLDNVIVIAATNMSDMLDEALVRPGRFDRKYTISNPDKKARKELFDMYLKNKTVDSSVDIDRLVGKTYGFSCAQIENVINEAAILALKAKRTAITGADFEEAVVHILLNGSSKKDYEQNEKTRKLTAYHEAGHAIIAYKTGKTVNSISIIPVTSGAGGYTMSEIAEESFDSIEDYRHELMELYGGRCAEICLAGGDLYKSTNGCSSDIAIATEFAMEYIALEDGIIYSVFGDNGFKIIVDKIKPLMKEIQDETCKMLQDNWSDVEKVADALLEKETLSAEEFLELFNSGKSR